MIKVPAQVIRTPNGNVSIVPQDYLLKHYGQNIFTFSLNDTESARVLDVFKRHDTEMVKLRARISDNPDIAYGADYHIELINQDFILGIHLQINVPTIALNGQELGAISLVLPSACGVHKIELTSVHDVLLNRTMTLSTNDDREQFGFGSAEVFEDPPF